MGKKIKIFGERNTNTNYMSKLIQLNLKVDEVSGVAPSIIMKLQKILPGKELVRDIYFEWAYKNNLGWKHTCVKPSHEMKEYELAKSNLLFLTITKNPYSWLLSLYRRPYHQYYIDSPSIEEFLQRQWVTVGRDNIKNTLKNPIELWNIKNRSYLTLDQKNAMHITTENIFLDPEAIIIDISKKHSIERKLDSFINYEISTKDESKDSTYYKEYYLSEKWRDSLSNEAIEIINESVDKELMSHFGYSMLK